MDQGGIASSQMLRGTATNSTLPASVAAFSPKAAVNVVDSAFYQIAGSGTRLWALIVPVIPLPNRRTLVDTAL